MLPSGRVRQARRPRLRGHRQWQRHVRCPESPPVISALRPASRPLPHDWFRRDPGAGACGWQARAVAEIVLRRAVWDSPGEGHAARHLLSCRSFAQVLPVQGKLPWRPQLAPAKHLAPCGAARWKYRLCSRRSPRRMLRHSRPRRQHVRQRRTRPTPLPDPTSAGPTGLINSGRPVSVRGGPGRPEQDPPVPFFRRAYRDCFRRICGLSHVAPGPPWCHRSGSCRRSS